MKKRPPASGKVRDYGFGSIRTDDGFTDIPPIQRLTEQDFAVQDIAGHLKIHPDDAGTLKEYYGKAKADSEVFLFRYAVTDYWTEDLSVFEIQNGEHGTHHNGAGELRQGTQFFDFDILELTFNRDGVYTVIPAVSSPTDHIAGYTPSIEAEDNDWWKRVAGAVLLLLLLLLLFPLLPYLVKGLVWILCLPFKGIAALGRAIKKSSEKRNERKEEREYKKAMRTMDKTFERNRKNGIQENKRRIREAEKADVGKLKEKVFSGEKSQWDLSKAERYALEQDEEYASMTEIYDNPWSPYDEKFDDFEDDF